ncbi:MATE family efflux transporter [Flavobacterium sp. 81]|uniref:MATE family efflux transporter n=1 Tax=Flavobacterium sp. 81 TaxID=2135621 RepID=UPI0018F6672E
MLKKYKSNKIYYQSTITLAGPVVISQLGHTLVQTFDTIIIGHYAGTISLAAVSLVHSVFMVVLVIGLGVAYGLTPLIAQENGKSNFKECAELLSNSLWLNVAARNFSFCNCLLWLYVCHATCRSGSSGGRNSKALFAYFKLIYFAFNGISNL